MKSEDGNKFEYFPVEKLSKQEKSRFRQLYMYRNRFTLEEIQPYIRDFVNITGEIKSSSVIALLMKYTKLVEGFYIPSDALEIHY